MSRARPTEAVLGAAARARAYHPRMDTILALLLIAWHLLFGCGGADPGRAPPADPPASAAGR